ncbi:MAG: glycosyl hydrolase [bacterium]
MKIVESDLLSLFRSPPVVFGPVPFYWWAGEKLDQERMVWQLDQLCAKGVKQTVVSYPHRADGPTDVGEPALFSPAWWHFFRWFLRACRERDMTVGIQDYTLCHPILQTIGRDTPDMEGGQLSCVWEKVGNGEEGNKSVRLSAEPGTRVIGAWAYRRPRLYSDVSAVSVCAKAEAGSAGLASSSSFGDSRTSEQARTPIRPARLSPNIPIDDADKVLDLSGQVRDGVLTAELPEGEWLVALVFARLNPFDPLHPDSGKLAIERLYEPFVRECPGEVGRTLTLFFQDELDFGSRMPFWSNRLVAAFQDIHGYDVRPLLPALWLDLGPLTEKVRLDFAEAVTRRIEACYFEPVFRWHEAHNTLFGHDNSGRGEIATGRQYYADYFRAMRWYSAPGCDDPKLANPRAFKGLKVNSSIAHLYQRPRVWIEAFHSSGWGTKPAEVVAALNEDFAYGATVVNLHGLYYTTRGGWWEWASPDFHFRQPYWEHVQALNIYCTRLSWLLSQGVHRCDVAMLYPVAALHALPEAAEVHRLVAHLGNGMKSVTEADDPQPEECAFGLGKHLFDHACDFDFIDDESVFRATTSDGELRVSGESYRVLLLPAMGAIRFATLEKARNFVHAGGVVIAYGRLPCASERAGSDDPQMTELLQEIFGVADGESSHVKRHPSGGCGVFIRRGYDEVLRAMGANIVRDVESSGAPVQVLHRKLEDRDIYYLFNPATAPAETCLRLRAAGSAETWNAWTGQQETLPVDASVQGVCTVRMTLAAKESKVIVVGGRRTEDGGQRTEDGGQRTECLEGPWTFTVRPTLDNRFGDFRLPASEGCLGPEARRFRTAEETAAGVKWHEAGFDDSAWDETTYSFGPRFASLGPLLPGADSDALERRLCSGDFGMGAWQPYAFSLRWGIERDPFLTHWLSGPHGLKGSVPDEYLDFQSDTPGSVWYLKTEVFSETEREVPFVMGGRCAYRVWLNGKPVLEQAEALPPGLHPPWNIPHYGCEPQMMRVMLHPGINWLLLKLIQSEGQRTRAFAAFSTAEADSQELGLRWFRELSAPRPALPAGPERRAVWFRFLAPPGLQDLCFVARGVTQAWADGRELTIKEALPLPDGSMRYRTAVTAVSGHSVHVALRVEALPEFRAGDVLPEPVGFVCGAGELPLGDWCEYGLGTYSGQGEYTKTFAMKPAELGERLFLDVGEVAATAEVRVNGVLAGTLLASPWRVEVTELIHKGTNVVSIFVANTLANHYSIGIPTPYAFPEQTKSGLFGPVRLVRCKE